MKKNIRNKKFIFSVFLQLQVESTDAHKENNHYFYYLNFIT